MKENFTLAGSGIVDEVGFTQSQSSPAQLNEEVVRDSWAASGPVSDNPHDKSANRFQRRRSLVFWEARFADLPELLALPTDRRRSEMQTGCSNLVHCELGSALTDRVRRIAKALGTDLQSFMLTAFKTYLFRLTRQNDLIVAVALAGRSFDDRPSTAGLQADYMPVRTRPASKMSFCDYLAVVDEEVSEANRMLPVDLGDQAQLSELSTDLSRVRITNVGFKFSRLGEGKSIDERTTATATVARKCIEWDCLMDVVDTGETLKLTWEFNESLFLSSTIEKRVQGLEVLLEGIVRDPSCSIARLPLLSHGERQYLLHTLNDTAGPYPDHSTINELFDAQALRSPDATALIFEDQTMSYGTLLEKSNQLANYLIELGVVPGMRVGVSINRSFEMVIALLGIMKAGASMFPWCLTIQKTVLIVLTRMPHLR